MDIGTKYRLLEEIEEMEEKGSVSALSERFRAYVVAQERLREEMYRDFEIRTREYIYLIDDYRTVLARYQRKYKRLKISYITLFIAALLAFLYYLLIMKLGFNVPLPNVIQNIIDFFKY